MTTLVQVASFGIWIPDLRPCMYSMASDQEVMATPVVRCEGEVVLLLLETVMGNRREEKRRHLAPAAIPYLHL